MPKHVYWDQWCLICSHVQSEEAVIPPKDSDVGATDELQSKVGELEDKLEASQEVEREQQEEITHLKERLVQALSAQVNMHFQDFFYCVYLFWAHILVHNRTQLLKSSHCQGPGSHS